MIVETVFVGTRTGTRVVIPLDTGCSVLGMQMSGGADSALLCYLVVRSIQQHSLPIMIRPITCEVATKPPYLATAMNVVARIASLTGFVQWAAHAVLRIPIEQSAYPTSVLLLAAYLKELVRSGQIDEHFAGVTRNPPEADCAGFARSELRRVGRDNPDAALRIPGGAFAPLKMHDKRVVIDLYLTLGVFDTLFPITVSCDAFAADLVDGRMPCNNCWWCDERKWSLRSYGLPDHV